MSWRDRYKEASFRGKKFYVRAADTEFGRRVNFYDIAFDESKGSASRDMGTLPRRYMIEAILLGENYDQARDALMDAVEQAGPGTLVHPYLGKITVVVEPPARTRETTSNGGMATINFTCRKHREKPSPAIGLDTAGDLLQAGTDAIDTLNSDFVDAFSLDGVQEFVRDASAATLGTAISTLSNINRDIDAILALPGEVASDIAELANQIEDLLNTPQELINAIQDTILSIFASIDRILGSFGSLSSSGSKVDDMFENIEAVSTRDTPNRKTQRKNQDAIVRAVKGTALVAGCLAALNEDITYESSAEAITVRDEFLAYLDTFSQSDSMDSERIVTEDVLEEKTSSVDAVYAAMKNVATKFSLHMSSVAGELPRVTTYTPPESLPTFVIAYQLYGDADRNLEIEDRNKDTIKNPLFCPGAVDLEVLSSV